MHGMLPDWFFWLLDVVLLLVGLLAIYGIGFVVALIWSRSFKTAATWPRVLMTRWM